MNLYSTKDSKHKLRVGLILDSYLLPKWASMMLEILIKSNYAQIVLLLVIPESNNSKNSFKNFIYRKYCDLEYKRAKFKDNAIKLTSSHDILSGIPELEIDPQVMEEGSLLENGDIKQIEQYNLDVLILLSDNKPQDDTLLRLAKYGLWFLPHFSDNNGKISAGFWEVVNNIPTTESELIIQNKEHPVGISVFKSHSSTNRFSVVKNRNKYYWKSLLFIPRKLRALYISGSGSLYDKIPNQDKNPPSEINRRVPSNISALSSITSHMFRTVLGKLDKQIFKEDWIILFRLSNEKTFDFKKFKKMIPPKNTVWADPFVVYKHNTYHIFMEEIPNNSTKGRISLIKMDLQGNYQQPVSIIEKPYHLSYPYIFEWEGEYYMIPESSADKSIQLYKCSEFPYKWDFVHNLMENIRAYDTTLLFHQGKWWLFANIKEITQMSGWDELYLFHADTPVSRKWVPHPLNPVISDARTSRPAGKIYKERGKIFRPAQNSSYRYGYGLKLNQITKLNEYEYEEIEFNSFEPDWDNKIVGVHTVNRDKDLTVIDGIYKRSKFAKL